MIRISWTINGRSGCGGWIEATPKHKDALRATVAAMNAKHGAGSHRIESKEAT